MRITQINITIPASGHYLAYVNLVFDNAYALNGVRITQRGDGGLQVIYPRLPRKEGCVKRQIYAFKPLSLTAHAQIENAVLTAYKRELDKRST